MPPITLMGGIFLEIKFQIPFIHQVKGDFELYVIGFLIFWQGKRIIGPAKNNIGPDSKTSSEEFEGSFNAGECFHVKVIVMLR
jgi:hypothetical protein